MKNKTEITRKAIEIKSWITGAVLFSAQVETVRECVIEARKSRANLSGANLYGADLSRANLYGANLYGANLSRADLYGARGADPNLTTPLRILLDQPGKIRAYKLVTADGEGPFNEGIKYEIGKSCEAKADTDEKEHCGSGINLATLDWCMKEWQEGYRILVVEFEAADIAAIPIATDGKFRVHRCLVVAEKDCKALGLGQQKKADAA